MTNFEVCVYADNIESTAFSDKVWILTGMKLDLKINLKILKTKQVIELKILNYLNSVSDVVLYIVKEVFEIPSNWILKVPLIEITPNKKTL